MLTDVHAADIHSLRLLDAEPELAGALGGPALDAARQQVVVPALELNATAWTPPTRAQRSLALLVVRGLVIQDHVAFGRPHLQLFGPGDLIDPRALVERAGGWRALVPATVAVIDARLLAATRRWPQLFGALTSRIFDSQHEQHMLAGMAMLPRVEDRLLTLLCHLAERWGQVTPDGVALQLPMTHEMLGRMVGARRPTVSLAITDLTARDRLKRLEDGRWLLPLDDVSAPMPAATGGVRAVV